MEGLLDAANVTPDKFTIRELPVKSGEVSIMTLKQVYEALGGDSEDTEAILDPTKGYNTSTYYMYAINDTACDNDSVLNSTLDNLQLVGIDWYRKLNKPTRRDNRWVNAGEGTHTLFGGPLKYVNHFSNATYVFCWYYSESGYGHSSYISNWGEDVPGDVYVAVVRK